MEVAQKTAAKRYNEFDTKRKKAEAFAADEEDIRDLESLEKKLTKRGGVMMSNLNLPIGWITTTLGTFMDFNNGVNAD